MLKNNSIHQLFTFFPVASQKQGGMTKGLQFHARIMVHRFSHSLSRGLSKYLLRAIILFAVASTLALGLPSQARAAGAVVYDPAAVAAINQLITLIQTQTNGIHLNGIKISLMALITQGVLSPSMVSAVTVASQSVSTSMSEFITYSVGEGVQLDLLAATVGTQKNLSDPRFYSRLTTNPSGCGKSLKIVGIQIIKKCLEIQNLRTYKVLHSGKFQRALAISAASILSLSNIPSVNRADVELKNQTINLIRLIQSQASEIYRAQQDYLQGRIEISEEIRVALVNKKSGNNSGESGTASTMFNAARKLIN